MTSIHLPGAKWHHQYEMLPSALYSLQEPEPVQQPGLVMLNAPLAAALGLDFSGWQPAQIAAVFAGNQRVVGTRPLAMAYAGHQFGHLSVLGDGRAVLMGEHMTPEGTLVDIQFKGSGRTAYSRTGDGRAALGPMLREYVISEAMWALGIPTTRSLAVVTTGEDVYRAEPLSGAILTRIAQSHIRVGTFEFAALRQNSEDVSALVSYAIERHQIAVEPDEAPAVALLHHVCRVQARLIAQWMSVGFIHGVMNTDNMTISGETIDYGPCAFMDTYNPATVFSSIDQWGRYAYANQPPIGKWNIARLAEALLPLLHSDQDTAIEIGEAALELFETSYGEQSLMLMRRKLGLLDDQKGDQALVRDLLTVMVDHGADFTRTFWLLDKTDMAQDGVFATTDFAIWRDRWLARRQGQKVSQDQITHVMAHANPSVVPRNHLVEQALEDAESGHMERFTALLAAVTQPFAVRQATDPFTQPSQSNQPYQTFCGT